MKLEPLEFEGGYFCRTYRSSETISRSVLPERYKHDKSLATSIYYLLTAGTCSRLHRLPTDEVYHFYLGDPVELLMLYPDGNGRMVTLGQRLDLGQEMQVVVPAGVWQGSSLVSGGSYALMGMTMSPGFDRDDFEPAERRTLIEQYPGFEESILALAD